MKHEDEMLKNLAEENVFSNWFDALQLQQIKLYRKYLPF